MTLRTEWRRQLRQNLARLGRLSLCKGDAIGAGLFISQCKRMLHSRIVLAATLAEVSGMNLSDDAIWEQSATIDLFAAHDRAVRWFGREKPSGGVRAICLPDLALKVRQRLLTRMIVAQQAPDPQIFNWKGRGCPRQANQIKLALEAGNRYVVVADVRDCFPSVNFDAVLDLDLLPPEVLRFASDGRHLNFVQVPDPHVIEQPSNTTHTHTIGVQAGPRGLLQGLGSSDAMWVSLIGDLPDRLSAFGTPFVYCDNVAVACGTKHAAAEAKEALARYFSDHRAGPFSLTIEVHDAYSSFEHTGYMFGVAAQGNRLKASIMPSVANACKLMGRLAGDVRRAGGAGMCRDDAAKLFDHRLSAFSAVTQDYRDELFTSFIAELGS